VRYDDDVKRRLAKLVAFLLLGAIVNVVVAWTATNWNPGAAKGSSVISTDADLSLLIEAGWTRPPERNSGYHVVTDVYATVGSMCRLHDESLGWDDHIDRYETGSYHTPVYRLGADLVAGWPCYSLVCVVLYDRPSKSRFGTHYYWCWRAPFATLPYRPLWPGFAINALFYAGILWGGWLMFAAPFALRRRRRIKRGLCPACAYPIGKSDVCTECGKRLPVRPS
jgi:hypothetical protein